MKRATLPLLVAILFLAVSGCGAEPQPEDTVTAAAQEQAAATATAPPAVLEISTTAFAPGGQIPERHSCFGDNVSPPLEWSGVPAEAESLLLLLYDLDAGTESGASTAQGFAHWIVYNIPPTTTGYAEDVPAGENLDSGEMQGSNDFAQFAAAGDTFPSGAPIKLVGYDGPCPGGEHRYAFALYALDTTLDLPAAATMAQVLAAMEGHVISQAEVVGVFTPPQ